MLFRSDLLKRRCIPDHVERRQQHLSRVAGQSWNALGPKEKAFWQEKAAQVLLEHQLKNPNYKFTPAPRGSRRGKGKGRLDSNGDDVDEEARIRQIREKYVIPGPTVAPARRRRPRHQNLIRDADITLAHYSTVSEPSRSPASSMPPSPVPFPSPEFEYRQEATLPPCWPQHTLPQVMPPRRPSTSLGFATATPSSMRPTLAMATSRSSPAASDFGAYMENMHLPPTASKVPPVYPLQPANGGSFLCDSAPIQDEVTFPNSNSSFTSTPSPESLSTPETMGSESFLDSLCINDPFTFNLPIASAEDQFTALPNTYFDYPSASQGPWPTFDVSAFGEASSFAHVRTYST
ncbi:hypothetical protein H0H93_002337 [Arthromyces matolae]|nr:hypothetical protein H0H93_002337 [Arthromyces matolae]